MREIKFRAWDKKQKEMIHVDKFLSNVANCGKSMVWDHNMRIDNRGGLLIDGDIGILMQFTGLKDKNGKEIYEGDIVLHDGYNSEIKFFDCAFFLDTSINYAPKALSHMLKPDLKVIGNIHKNPELLKLENHNALSKL